MSTPQKEQEQKEEPERMSWKECAECFEKISAISGRKKITKILSNYFSRCSEKELVHSAYLSIARISSESNGIELNIGENILLKVLSEYSCTSPGILKKRMKEAGDISVIVKSRKKTRLGFTKTKPLLLSEVFTQLQNIAEQTGKDSSQKKIQLIGHLLTRCTEDTEIKYILRILEGKLKIGISTQTALTAIALAVLPKTINTNPITKPIKNTKHLKPIQSTKKIKIEDNTNHIEQTDDVINDVIDNIEQTENKEAELVTETIECLEGLENEESEEIEWNEEEISAMELVKEAYSQLPSLQQLITIIKEKGLKTLSDSLVTPGYPLRPMLAMAEKDPISALARFKDTFLVEYKYDGERVQAHKDGDILTLFSRGLENTTERFSQILPSLKKSFTGGDRFIIDAEIVAYDREKEKILPFQVLSNRKRKATEENQNKEESDTAIFIFDILYLDKPLTKLSLPERKEILRRSFKEVPGEVYLAHSHQFKEQNLDSLNALFTQSIAFGCEGLMVKCADSTSSYEPSKRSQKWIKLKSDYITGLHETLDLIVIGAYHGKGKRTGVYGGFLLGCPNDNGEIETITKIGTGFSDTLLQQITADLEEYKTILPVAEIDTATSPDVWFRPHFVWEVATAGISVSPRYTAGRSASDLGDSKGLSLRFPRFIRFRSDKTPETATSSSQIVSLFLQGSSSSDK
ncbi:DNA ligase 1 [Nematocida sp. AWRm80]|nr:DNA ligase 1 [Nematocida sp. AWRm80]